MEGLRGRVGEKQTDRQVVVVNKEGWTVLIKNSREATMMIVWQQVIISQPFPHSLSLSLSFLIYIKERERERERGGVM